MHRNWTKTLIAIIATILVDAAPAAAGADADPALQTVPLASGRAATAGTHPFSLVGVTWDDPRAALGSIRVRTRATGTGRWTPWQALESDGPAEGDRRGASDPLWVGPSDAVQTRIDGPQPAGLRLDLINPDAPVPRTPARPEPESTSTRPVPKMITRAGWGANEGIVRGGPHYTGPVDVFFVHHTATGNSYSCSDSASIVRSIQAYQVRSRGWDDIGYNFLVDKCGTLFEGRAGGVSRSVMGAHTLGFNRDSSAIAVIGNYESVGANPAVRTVIATVAAYKVGAYGNNPAGRVTFTSGGGNKYPAGTPVTLFRISGHRDAGRTACPGDSLYAQLPAIRAIAGAAPSGLRLLRTGATRVGTTLRTTGPIRLQWTVATPSPLIDRFQVLVDGRVTATTAGTSRSAALILPGGTHSVAVRAIHLSGRTSVITTRIVSSRS